MGDISDRLFTVSRFEQLIHNLDADSIINLCQTNSSFRDICNDPVLWKRLIRRDYGIEPTWDDPRKEYLNRKRFPVDKEFDLFSDILPLIPTFPGEYTCLDQHNNLFKYTYEQIKSIVDVSVNEDELVFGYNSQMIDFRYMYSDIRDDVEATLKLRYFPEFQELLDQLESIGITRFEL